MCTSSEERKLVHLLSQALLSESDFVRLEFIGILDMRTAPLRQTPNENGST